MSSAIVGYLLNKRRRRSGLLVKRFTCVSVLAAGTAPCPHLPVSKEEDPLCIAHLPFRQNLGLVSRRRLPVHLTIPHTASLVRNLSPNPLPSAVQVEMKRILWKQQIVLSDMTYCRVSYSCRFFNAAVDNYAQLCTVLLTSSPVPSDCSSDSFHSTLDEVPPPFSLPSSLQLYHTGLQHAMQGQVIARTLRYTLVFETPGFLVWLVRTKELGCSGDLDFLAKLYCVRLAFDELTADAGNRLYLQQMGREIMSNFLTATGSVSLCLRSKPQIF